MAIAKLEPTGISVRKGGVQLRICLYLEPNDVRYNEHHVFLPIMPPEGYQGEVDEVGTPTDKDAYNVWVNSLPKEWQDNPFHNHFLRVSPDITDAEINSLLEDTIEEFYGIWKRGEDISNVWKPKRKELAGNESSENTQRCKAKAQDITKRASSFSTGG